MEMNSYINCTQSTIDWFNSLLVHLMAKFFVDGMHLEAENDAH